VQRHAARNFSKLQNRHFEKTLKEDLGMKKKNIASLQFAEYVYFFTFLPENKNKCQRA